MHEPPFDVNRPEWTPLNFYPAPTCTPLPDLRLTPSGRPPDALPKSSRSPSPDAWRTGP